MNRRKIVLLIIIVFFVALLFQGCPDSSATSTPLPTTYSVSYDDNGATGGSIPDSQTKTKDVNLTLASNSGKLLRTGYTFDGWNTAADGSGTNYAEGATYSTNAALTLYAKWTPTYSVSYDANGATGGSAPTSQVKTENTDLTLSSNSGNLVRTGYTLAGWNTAADGSGTNYAEGATYTANAGVTLYAQWKQDVSSPNIGTLKVVPAGSFKRDSTATNISEITAPFYMSEHEITRAQFNAIMGDDPSDTSHSSGTSDPVQRVNWYHAIAFCNKLSIAEGLEQVYSVSGVDFSNLTFSSIPTGVVGTWDAATVDWTANGYRLPTEMEWMWAAMGAEDDYTKPFAGSDGNNVIGDYAVFGCYGRDTGKTTTERSNPVGSKLPNELGLYDMSGNVLEWTWDRHAAYPTGTLTDYHGAALGTTRVARGGCWNFNASNCTVAIRYKYTPNSQYNNIGFRVVRP